MSNFRQRIISPIVNQGAASTPLLRTSKELKNVLRYLSSNHS